MSRAWPAVRGMVPATAVVAALVLLGAVPTALLIDQRSSGGRGAGFLPARGTAGSLMWADEFRGRAGPLDPRRWSFETGGRWHGELQSYTARPVNASIDGKGHLAITARRERYRGADGVVRWYTSARLNTNKKFVFAYGRVEARIRVSTGAGIRPAFWALGANLESAGWPASGEIDVMEVDSSDPAVLFGTLHGPTRHGGHYSLRVQRRMAAPASDAFHVYGITWMPGGIVFTVDGQAYGAFTRGDQPAGAPWTFDHPFYLLFTMAIGRQALRAPNATTRWPARMLVDWVRVWRLPATYCPTVSLRYFRGRCPR